MYIIYAYIYSYDKNDVYIEENAASCEEFRRQIIHNATFQGNQICLYRELAGILCDRFIRVAPQPY